MKDQHDPGVDRDAREEALRAAFVELRGHDEATAPPFASLWGRPARPPRAWWRWALPAATALATAVLVLALLWPSASPPPPRLVGVAEPEPLAFLLVRPARGAP